MKNNESSIIKEPYYSINRPFLSHLGADKTMVLQYLIEQDDDFPKELKNEINNTDDICSIPLTKEAIIQVIGISNLKLARIKKEFEKKGIIKKNQKKIAVDVNLAGSFLNPKKRKEDGNK